MFPFKRKTRVGKDRIRAVFEFELGGGPYRVPFLAFNFPFKGCLNLFAMPYAEQADPV